MLSVALLSFTVDLAVFLRPRLHDQSNVNIGENNILHCSAQALVCDNESEMKRDLSRLGRLMKEEELWIASRREMQSG